MAATRILSIIGRKDAGKTTLAVALASEFVRKGRRVMTIKHTAQRVELDTASATHFHEGKAERTLLVSPELRALYDRHPDDSDPIALTRRYLDGADIVLVEGWRDASIPKIEVIRRATGTTPMFEASLPDAKDWLAIVTDDDHFQASCTVLRFHDTMWLHLLASLAWDKARII